LLSPRHSARLPSRWSASPADSPRPVRHHRSFRSRLHTHTSAKRSITGSLSESSHRFACSRLREQVKTAFLQTPYLTASQQRSQTRNEIRQLRSDVLVHSGTRNCGGALNQGGQPPFTNPAAPSPAEPSCARCPIDSLPCCHPRAPRGGMESRLRPGLWRRIGQRRDRR